MTDKIKLTLTLLIETVEFEPPDFDSEEEQEEDEESEDEGNKLGKNVSLTLQLTNVTKVSSLS